MEYNTNIYAMRMIAPAVLQLQQGSNAIPMFFKFCDYVIPNGAEARLYVRKPSSLEVYVMGTIERNGAIFETTTQMTAEDGRCEGQIQIIKDSKILNSFLIYLDVAKSIISDSAIESKDEFGILDTLINQAREEIKNAQNAISAVNTAAESANAAALNANESAALANTAASNANVAASSAETNADLAMKAAISALDGKEAATSAAMSANAAADRANEAAGNIEQANIKPLAYFVSGESITAGNSAEKPLIGLTVHGRADQVSTTGAQLFNKSTVTPESYVRDTDGTVVASTTRPTCASDYITLDGAESIYITSTMASNRWGAFYNDKKEYVSGIAGYSSPITVPVGAVYIRLTVADDNLDTFMVNTGSTALPYEPYSYGVPSPSVEYPQAIDIAGNGGSINVKMTGKNLFDADSWEILDKQSDGSHKTNQATTQKNLQIDIPVGVYTLSYDCKSDADSNARLRVVYEDGTTGATVLPSNGTYVHFEYVTENKKISSIGTDFSRYGSGIELKRIQLEYGSVETSYEPYKSTQSVNLSTPNGLAGIKVSSCGNYTDASGQQWICDEIVRNERGTGKRIQRIGKSKVGDNSLSLTTASNGNKALVISNIPNKIASVRGTLFSMAQVPKIVGSDGLQTGSAYENATNFVIVGTPDDTLLSLATKYGNCEFLYVLAEPVETDLSTEEIAALSALHTYYPTTTISNDAGCDMTAAYVTQYYQGVGDAMFYGVADNLTTEASGTSVLDAHQGKVLDNKIGALNDLETTAKSSAVAAINEVKSETVSLIPTVLFDSPTRVGSGTFTESIYNFERIRIYYKIRYEYGSVDIYTSFIPTDGVVDLIGFFDFNNYLGAHLHRINLTDTTFSTVYAYQYFPPSAEKTDVVGDDAMAIYRVEGYRS